MVRWLLPVLVVVAFWVTADPGAMAAEQISAPVAADKARAGELVFIDIRRPQEWQQSGVAVSAQTLSMHEEGFLKGLERLTGGDRSKPVALICATGARSTWLSAELEKRGYTNVRNVREGMFGSQAGPGWLKRKLPTRVIR